MPRTPSTYPELQHFRHLPEVLRRWRLQTGRGSQHEIAERVGVAFQTWSHYETGQIVVPLGRLDGILQALGKSLDDLVIALAEIGAASRPAG
ncbi:MAG: helix-turn-helix transcriptional regulator [Acidobacteriota bacterium]